MLGSASDIAAILTGFLAFAAAGFAYYEWQHRAREWKYRTSHWLYIPAPKSDDGPLDSSWWVYPPVPLDATGDVADTDEGAERFAVPISGKVINAGPADAFSVRVFADPEASPQRNEGHTVAKIFARTCERFERHQIDACNPNDVDQLFASTYHTRNAYIPVLRVGEALRFTVIAEFELGDELLQVLRSDTNNDGVRASGLWTVEGRQRHRVHAASRSVTGHRLVFEPGDLCSPFEGDSDFLAWADGVPEPSRGARLSRLGDPLIRAE